MVVEYADDIIIIDCGLMFPEEDMPGVDLVIPDVTYLVERKDQVRGIIITHGHEDHIGALPYILPQLDVPIYCAPLPHGLISVKLKEAHVHTAKIHEVQPGVPFELGAFKIEFVSMCHSIPDSAGLIINTPVGTIVHSGDFKLDYTPVDCRPTDLARLAQAGADGVLLLLADSTHVELAGYTPSERVVGETISNIMSTAPGRVLVTTFASLVARIQQVMDAAVKYNRKIFIAGRGMNEIVKMALKMGYLKVPDGQIGDLTEMHRLPPNRIALITTGSQGEPTSALVRIANREHRDVQIKQGDTVIISASPIPGNESVVVEDHRQPVQAGGPGLLRPHRQGPRPRPRLAGGTQTVAEPDPAAVLRTRPRRIPPPETPRPTGGGHGRSSRQYLHPGRRRYPGTVTERRQGRRPRAGVQCLRRRRVGGGH